MSLLSIKGLVMNAVRLWLIKSNQVSEEILTGENILK